MNKPKVTYFCNKCGYVGPASEHAGCGYLACTNLTQQWTDQLEAEITLLKARCEAHSRDANRALLENAALREQLAAAQADAIEQARIVGMGAEREAALLGKVHTLERKLAAAQKGLSAVRDLIEESQGVYGLHMNGDRSPWEELRTGGRFETWLADFDAAIAKEKAE